MVFRLIALSLLLCVSSILPIRAAETPVAIQVSEALHRDTIASLDLKSASFHEVLSAVRRDWERTHPGLPFLIGITEFEGFSPDPKAKITMNCKNIRYMQALEFLAHLSGTKLKEMRGMVQIKPVTAVDGDWSVKERKLSAELLAKLGISPKASGEEVKAAFRKFGVEFQDWTKASFVEDGTILLVLNLNTQQELIDSIIELLDKGFTIRK